MVSLIRLIASGARYEEKEITTTGILVYRFEEPVRRLLRESMNGKRERRARMIRPPTGLSSCSSR